MMLCWNMWIVHVNTVFLSRCVVFRWKSSLQDTQQSLWKSMVSVLVLKGTLSYIQIHNSIYIYVCISNPFERGWCFWKKLVYGSVKLALVPGTKSLQKAEHHLARYSSVSSCTLRGHGILWGQHDMPFASFLLEKDRTIFIPVNRGVHSLLRIKHNL
jgi:hypothetical protein